MQHNTSYRLPAEWEEQSGVQLTWPHAATDWALYLADITRTFVEMAAAITRFERLLVATPEPPIVREQLAGALSAEQLARVTIVEAPTNDTWARDHGAITLVPAGPSAAKEQPRLLDFKFNGWGEKFASAHDNALTRRLHEAGVLNGERVDCLHFVLEGGAIESDGRGTVFTTSQCLLAPHRNQPLTQTEIEEELKRKLCADRVVWLDHGNLIGDDTDGHIDTIVRVAPGDTLLYVAPDESDTDQLADFQALERQLQALRTADGKTPYTLLPLPMPRAIYDDGERLPATYANFLVINGAVIVPTYDQPDLDAVALEQIGKAFPGRELIAIDGRTIIRQHGSIHCLTMQFPSGIIA